MASDLGHTSPRDRLVRDFSIEDSYFQQQKNEYQNPFPPRSAKSPPPSSPDSRMATMQVADEARSPNVDPANQRILSPIEEQSYFPSSNASLRSASQHTAVSTTSSGRLTDFFGIEVFQIVLHNPTTAHQLTKFAQKRFCGENMEFLEQVDRYNALLNDMTKTMFDIHKNYISVNAANQLNLPEHLMLKINKDLKATLTSTLPKMESIFTAPQDEIEHIVSSDIYPRFVRHQMTMSAVKALAGDRSKYAGLGDCFVLTDPAKADNPIVYASDGFVKVTGYTRNDIIPRNCRFLQGRHTDRASVKRIKIGIDTREETVELLLNYKKNGEPFWNLLYTTPLFDLQGNVAFFLGGQINCSTTIHNCSDILRILSTPQDVSEDGTDDAEKTAAVRSSSMGRNGWLKAFTRSMSGDGKTQAAPRNVGMENNLLNRIEKMNLQKQMDVFYTAYSKYLIINYETMFISFFSAGIVDLLYPAKPNNGQIVGVDIFRFLSHHANSLSRDFKSKVKNALKVGLPVSLDLQLCTRRYMGFEKFVTHWTPLKDEAGKVRFVVLTMGAVGE